MAFAHLATWHVYDDTGRRKYLNAEEYRRFLLSVQDLDPVRRALCCALAFTGCRISEVLGIARYHVDAARCTLTLKTLKRRKVTFRTVPIPRELVAMLMALPQQAGDLFWTVHRTTAWRWIKRVMARVSIAGPMACCRGLRHGFGMRAAGRNVPPNLIQRWLGHASLNTTSVYLDAVGLEEQAFSHRMWSDAGIRLAAEASHQFVESAPG